MILKNESMKNGVYLLKEMPSNVFRGGPCAWRYTDYPRPGSIYRLPDDHRLQRGPTIVRLPGGREMRVPASWPRSVKAPGQVHDTKNAQVQIQNLIAVLTGKKPGMSMPPGISQAPTGRPEIGRHPWRMPRQYPGIGGLDVHA